MTDGKGDERGRQVGPIPTETNAVSCHDECHQRYSGLGIGVNRFESTVCAILQYINILKRHCRFSSLLDLNKSHDVPIKKTKTGPSSNLN